jgi:hypothetical protein
MKSAKEAPQDPARNCVSWKVQLQQDAAGMVVDTVLTLHGQCKVVHFAFPWEPTIGHAYHVQCLCCFLTRDNAFLHTLSSFNSMCFGIMQHVHYCNFVYVVPNIMQAWLLYLLGGRRVWREWFRSLDIVKYLSVIPTDFIDLPEGIIYICDGCNTVA